MPDRIIKTGDAWQAQLFADIIVTAHRVVAPALIRVDRDLSLDHNDALRGLDAPALAWVRGSLRVTDNAALPDLAGLAGLATIDGYSQITRNASLTHLGLTSLATAADVLMIGATTTDLEDLGNPSLEVIDLPALASVATLMISTNPALAALELPSLDHLDALYVDRNPGLATCAVARLVASLDQPPAAMNILDTDDAAACP